MCIRDRADTMIQLGPKQMTLGQAIAQLSAKNNQIKGRDPNNKYAEVLNKVRAAQTVDEANAALSNAGLGYNQQGELKGGKTRKTRKSKKGKKSRKGKKAKKSQRGGYRAVYKNTRRRSTRKTSPSSN